VGKGGVTINSVIVGKITPREKLCRNVENYENTPSAPNIFFSLAHKIYMN
jgi:hypothetical protein